MQGLVAASSSPTTTPRSLVTSGSRTPLELPESYTSRQALMTLAVPCCEAITASSVLSWAVTSVSTRLFVGFRQWHHTIEVNQSWLERAKRDCEAGLPAQGEDDSGCGSLARPRSRSRLAGCFR